MRHDKPLSEADLSPSRLRWRRFRRHRRGFYSLVILAALFGLSLFAHWLCVDPYAPLDVEDFEPYRIATATIRPVTRVERIQLAPDGAVLWCEGHPFTTAGSRVPVETLPPAIQEGIRSRLANAPSPALTVPFGEGTEIRLTAYAPRTAAPTSVRLLIRDTSERPVETIHATGLATPPTHERRESTDDSRIAQALRDARSGFVAPFPIPWKGGEAIVTVDCPPVSWPFRPVPGHWLGTDMAGRDVLSRLLHGLRISLSFGMLLVAASVLLGILAGAVQGYFAGWTDLVGQRLTEIWSAVPFLYVMILLGNTFGRSFALLLFCYAIFNWVGLAAYVRAEFLKLRVRPFVDAARMQGLSSFRIMMRHILPNALTPLITLVPFELVGAIGSLAALDYLGFGLPDGTPSWGDLLHQAQMVHRQAWWLILYPSLALFTVMLLGVFVGEGMREAYDPRK